MRAKIIAIGTSKGIHIPKYLLDKYGFGSKVDVKDIGSGILIKTIKKPREGWTKAFKKAAKSKHSILLPTSDWDKDEWKW